MTATTPCATMDKDEDMLLPQSSAESEAGGRPATTPTAAAAAASSSGSTPSTTSTRLKHSFRRFPKFSSLKSPSASFTRAGSSSTKNNNNTNNNNYASKSATAPTTSPKQTTTTTVPSNRKSARRLRSFSHNLLRLRGNASTSQTTTTTAAVTSAMTSLMTTSHAVAGARPQHSSVQSSASSCTSSSTSSTQQQQRREAREDYIKVVAVVQNAVARDDEEQQQQQQQQGDATRQDQYLQLVVAAADQRSPEEDQLALHVATNDATTQRQQETYSCATAILQHAYLESVCGRQHGREILEQEAAADWNSRTCSPITKRRMIPDDPTVQDSIECVFASQLANGISLWTDDDEDYNVDDGEHRDPNEYTAQTAATLSSTQHTTNSYEEEPINAPSEAELPSPAPLMQSRQKSRTPFPGVTKSLIPSKRRSHPSTHSFHNNSNHKHQKAKLNSPHHHNLRFASDTTTTTTTNTEQQGGGRTTPKRSKKYPTAKVVHIGTFDPRTNRLLGVEETNHNLLEEDPMVRVAACHVPSPPRRNAAPCYCHSHSAPVVPAEYWPQAPLLLRPTPGEGMNIVGVRFSGKMEHFWKPSDGGWWLTPLYELAGKEAPSLPPQAPSMCSECCVLPINNGNEPVGESLVADFETPLFEGTLLLRLRHVDGGATCTDPALEDYDDKQGYFAGLNRRYQVVIRGKFKTEMPLTGLVAGCAMDRPYGKLPPKWIMKGAVKVLSFFAPQIEMQMDNPRPKTMAPLGSTPQALIVQDIGPNDTLPPLDANVEEPKGVKHSLLDSTYPGSSSLQRARGRKKAFDKLYAQKSKRPMTKTSSGSHETYYTFEFLQHLVNFQEFSVELGNLLGSIPIAPILSGQPIPVMAMTKEREQKLWSFDIWHENLVESAKHHDAKGQAAKKQ